MRRNKLLAVILSAAMILSMVGCGAKTEPAAEPAAEPVAEEAAAEEPAAEEPAAEEAAATDAGYEECTLTMSWWGGDGRHEATQAAIDKFMETYPGITVEPNFGVWDGWEDTMSTAFYAGTAPDVNQINWNWITSFSSDGSAFVDLNTLSDTIDLTQFSQSALDACTVNGELQAIPVAMTGRIFYWNQSTFEKAGIAVPTTLEELMAAGETFKTALGDDYYPIAMGEYDRMIFMVYYLESVYGKDWVVDNKLNYTQEEIATGFEFLQKMEDAHVIPSIETILGDGASSLDKNPKWIEGKYAGIFEWDSSAGKFKDALEEGNEMVVGNYFEDMGEFHGGYAKVSLAFAISETCEHQKEAAMLINFLLNEDEGIKLMASERGIPLSQAGLKVCQDNDLLNPMVVEANGKVLDWVDFNLDPKFEDAELKSSDGVYYDAQAGFSYGDYDASEAAEVLMKGIDEVLAK